MSIILTSIGLLPPPEGLNLEEISTDAGLLRAIEREAENIKEASAEGKLPTRDEIRLISFLAGEVRRRIAKLTSEQMDEFQRIREKARRREYERRIAEISGHVDKFIAMVEDPETAVPLGATSEIEIAINTLWNELSTHEEDNKELMDHVEAIWDRLVETNKKVHLARLPEF